MGYGYGSNFDDDDFEKFFKDTRDRIESHSQTTDRMMSIGLKIAYTAAGLVIVAAILACCCRRRRNRGHVISVPAPAAPGAVLVTTAPYPRQQFTSVQVVSNPAPYPQAQYPTAAAPYPTAAAPYPTAAAPYPTAAAPYPTAAAPYPTAAAPFPTTGSPYPTAGAPYPTAGAPYPTGGAPYASAASHYNPSAPSAPDVHALPPSYEQATGVASPPPSAASVDVAHKHTPYNPHAPPH